MRIVAIVPVKSTSDRLVGKNISPLNGKPLFLHTIEKLMLSSKIDEVFLDSDSEEIYKMAIYTGCSFLKRDSCFATNKTDGHILLHQAACKVSADIYVQVLVTAPFLTIETIEQGLSILLNNTDVDSVVCVKKEKQYCWDSTLLTPLYNVVSIPNSKDLPDITSETMGAYFVRNHVAIDQKRRYGGRVELLSVSPLEAMDVNSEEDLEFCNYIAKGIAQKEISYLNFLKRFINSAMISDTLDDLGYNTVVSGFQCNLLGSSVFGVAKTLKLRKLEDGENFTGIYDALESYDWITDRHYCCRK